MSTSTVLPCRAAASCTARMPLIREYGLASPPSSPAVLPGWDRHWYSTSGICSTGVSAASTARSMRSWSCAPSNPTRKPPMATSRARRYTVKWLV